MKTYNLAKIIKKLIYNEKRDIFFLKGFFLQDNFSQIKKDFFGLNLRK